MPELQSRPVSCASVFCLDSRVSTLDRNFLRLSTPTCSAPRFARALIPQFAVWPAKRLASDKPQRSWPEVFPPRSTAAEKGTGPASAEPSAPECPPQHARGASAVEPPSSAANWRPASQRAAPPTDAAQPSAAVLHAAA